VLYGVVVQAPGFRGAEGKWKSYLMQDEPEGLKLTISTEPDTVEAVR
jgi:hypothetical protein